jgi:SseB protein N-terminal domain
VTDPRFSGAPVPTPPLPDDDGTAPADLVRALRAAASGAGDGAGVLRALAASRLLVPVVAVLDESETGPEGVRRDKQSSMATVLVEAADGRRSLLAFTGTESLRAWQQDARPVPLAAPLAARAALDEGADALLVDAAGPVPFAVADGELLLLAAAARPPGDPSADPVVRAAARGVLEAVPGVEDLLLSAHLVTAAGPVGAEEPTVGLVLVADPPLTRDQLEPVLIRLQGDRVLVAALPGGLRVASAPSDRAPDTPDLLSPRVSRTRHHEGHD